MATMRKSAKAVMAFVMIVIAPATSAFAGGPEDCVNPCVAPATQEVTEVQTSVTNSTDIGAVRAQLGAVERKLNETRVYLGKLDRYAGQEFHDIVEQFEELMVERTALLVRIGQLEADVANLGDGVASNRAAIYALNGRVDDRRMVAGWSAGLGAGFGQPIAGATGAVQGSLRTGVIWGWEGAKVGHLFIPSLELGPDHVGGSFDSVTYWSQESNDLGFYAGVVGNHSGLGKGWSYTGASIGGHGGLWYSLPVGSELQLTLQPGVFAGLQGTRHQALPVTRLELSANLAWLWNSHADRE